VYTVAIYYLYLATVSFRETHNLYSFLAMTLEEAEQIDREQKLLPGGQGEHQFSACDSAEVVDRDLNNFAEQCGGFWFYNQAARMGVLTTCDEGTYRIYFEADGSRVNRVVLDTGFEYWDRKRERVRGIGYQESNAFEPLLLEQVEIQITV
jgi:hypothetical protein